MFERERIANSSLQYGYPLLAYAQWALPIISSVNTNHLKHRRQLANAADQTVVRPNVDTLYSEAVIDLSTSDLVMEVPFITDRYWLLPFYDA